MSLSRYFKSTDSFQPEEIVKKRTGIKPGWEAVKGHEEKVFQSQKIPDQTIPEKDFSQHEKTLSENPESTGTKQEDQTNTELHTADNNDQKHITAENDSLNNNSDELISLAEAKEKIETAYASGLKEGRDKAEADFGTAARALLHTCQQLETLRETLITNSGHELQEFALTIAERIIRTSVLKQDDTITATIEEALQRAVKSDEFTIYINPDDYTIVVAKSEEFIAGVSGLNNVVIKKDPTIERGGAKIESENCTIDATIASQFEIIRDEIVNSN